jgi:hypothetical protein
MKMVVTLKSGVQIKADVETFTTGTAQLSGELRNLKWTTTEQPGVKINWLNLEEIAAVHAEYDWAGEDAPDALAG